MRHLVLGILLASVASPAVAQTVSTVAGNGTNSYTGYGGPATAAGVPVPSSISVIPGGGFYIGAAGALMKVDSSGTITLVAGNGTAGFAGDNGPASAARVSQFIFGIAQGPDGSVYFSDWLNDRVRKVDSAGTITTVAGNGSAAASGDGGPAAAAGVAGPAGLEFDRAGNLYIAQYSRGSCRIRKLSPSGIITTFAGSDACSSTGDGGAVGAATFNNPWGLRFDANGNLFVSEHSGAKIRKITPAGVISTFVTLPALTGHIDFDLAGNLYVAVYGNSTIRKVDPMGNSTLFGGTGARSSTGDGGPALAASFFDPITAAVGEGRIYVAEYGGARVRAIAATVSPLPNGSAPTTCASEGYTGTKLTWCKNICESELSQAALDTWIHRWINRYRDLPYCAVAPPPPQG